MLKKINLKAQLIGNFTGLLTGCLMALVSGFLEAFFDYAQTNTLNEIPTNSLLIALYSIITGIVSGFTIYKTAKKYQTYNILVSGIAWTLISVPFIFTDSSFPLWYWILTTALIIPSFYMGGLLANKIGTGA